MDNKSSKNIDTSLYNEKALYLLNIRELRDIGRKFGVPSPTTMKKQDLISYILKIVYGEVEAPARSNFGRPNVREFNVDQYLAKIKKNVDITDELLKLKLDDVVDLGMSKVASPTNEPPELNIENRVFVEKDGRYFLKVHGFIDSEKDIEISESYAKLLELENFDVLEIVIQSEMFKVLTVNGISKNNKFDNFEIQGNKIIPGKNKVFNVSTEEKRVEIIEEIAKKCKENDINLLIFAQKKYNVNCTDSISYDKDEGYPLMYKNFMKMFAECESLSFEGKDIVVVLEDALDIEEMTDSFDKDVNLRFQNNINLLFKKFLGLNNLIVAFRMETEIMF